MLTTCEEEHTVRYFPKDKTLIFLDEPNHLVDYAQVVENEVNQSRENRAAKGEQTIPDNWICNTDYVVNLLNKRNCAAVCSWTPDKKRWKMTGKFHLTVRSISSFNNSFELNPTTSTPCYIPFISNKFTTIMKNGCNL